MHSTDAHEDCKHVSVLALFGDKHLWTMHLALKTVTKKENKVQVFRAWPPNVQAYHH